VTQETETEVAGEKAQDPYSAALGKNLNDLSLEGWKEPVAPKSYSISARKTIVLRLRM
jgi:hypothetical protein